jgi:membrane protein implicated in regulation of membrane protease activity
MFWIWLVVIVACVIVEICTVDMISIWFAVGGVVPFILSAATKVGYEWQILIFVVVSAALVLSLRRVTLKWLLKNNNEKTNIDAIVGQQHKLLEKADFETAGLIKINGIEWSVVPSGEKAIAKGKIVEILEVKGNKLVVKEIKKENLDKKGE